MTQHHHGRHKQDAQEVSHRIPCGILQLFHPGPSLTAVIAAALHGDGKLIGTAERRDEQRHQNGDQCLGALQEVSGLEIRGMKRSAMDIIIDISCTGKRSFFSGFMAFSRPSVSAMGLVV